jgi:hypothetical protein
VGKERKMPTAVRRDEKARWHGRSFDTFLDLLKFFDRMRYSVRSPEGVEEWCYHVTPHDIVDWEHLWRLYLKNVKVWDEWRLCDYPFFTARLRSGVVMELPWCQRDTAASGDADLHNIYVEACDEVLGRLVDGSPVHDLLTELMPQDVVIWVD